jgi:fructose-1-phosphate kinase PfkB-like protein
MMSAYDFLAPARDAGGQAMILAAGLTPAWQQIMRFAQVRAGEVNRAAEVHWCASGKAINVGVALAALRAPVHTLSPAGGWSGQAMRAEFAGADLHDNSR